MTELKNGNFVEVDFNIYANYKLVQTTNINKGKKAKLDIKKYSPLIMILGKNFIMKAFDEDIIKNKGKDNKLNLKPEEAYGKRKKELLKTFTKASFEAQKMRPILGVTYDFNGMFGKVKSVIGGRVLVDFNNPLAGKNIILEYSNVKLVKDISKKIGVIFEAILQIPTNMFKIEAKATSQTQGVSDGLGIVSKKNSLKDVKIFIPDQLLIMKEQLQKSFEEIIPEVKDYKLEFVKLVLKK